MLKKTDSGQLAENNIKGDGRMLKVGIRSVGSAIPVRKVSVEDTINYWGNSSVSLVQNKFGVRSRSVLNSDEDTLTLATQAAKNSLANAHIEAAEIDGVLFGTVTASELYRSSSNLLMDMLSNRRNYISSDISAAERSGVEAMVTGYSYIGAGLCTSALAIGSDAINRHTAPGDLRESYEGAGAGAIILGSQELIATIDHVSSNNSPFPQFGRPEDERFIRALTPMNDGMLKIGLYDHLKEAIKSYFEETHSSFPDYDFVILPQQYPGEVRSLAQKLDVSDKQINDSIFSEECGDTGSASSIIALEKVLAKSKFGNKILLCSYGNNSGADIVGLTVTKNIVKYQEKLQKDISNTTRNTIPISYAESLKLEYKLIQPNVTIGTFM